MHMQLRKSTVLASQYEDSTGKISPEHNAKWSRSTTKREDTRFEKLQEVFHLPLIVAASKFGIRSTAFKNRCRNMGIRQWPYRRIHSITKAIEKVYEVRCEEIQDDKLSNDKRGAIDRKQKYELRMNALQKELNEVYDPKKYNLTDHSSVFKKRKPLKLPSRKLPEINKDSGKVTKKRRMSRLKENESRQTSDVLRSFSAAPSVDWDTGCSKRERHKDKTSKASLDLQKSSDILTVIKKKRLPLSSTMNNKVRRCEYESDDSNMRNDHGGFYPSSPSSCGRRSSKNVRYRARYNQYATTHSPRARRRSVGRRSSECGSESESVSSLRRTAKHPVERRMKFHYDSESCSEESDGNFYRKPTSIFTPASPQTNFVLHQPRMATDNHYQSSMGSSSEGEMETSQRHRRYTTSSSSGDMSSCDEYTPSRKRFTIDGPSSLRSMRDGYWDSEDDDIPHSDTSYSKSKGRMSYQQKKKNFDLGSDSSSSVQNKYSADTKLFRTTSENTKGTRIVRDAFNGRKPSRETAIPQQCLEKGHGFNNQAKPQQPLVAV